MGKNDTFRSFQALDATRFPRAGNAPERDDPAGKRAAALSAPALEDESAVFLEAVSGTLDVSRNDTPDDADAPTCRAGRGKEQSAAPSADSGSARSRSQPEAIAAPTRETPQKPPIRADADLFATAMDGVRPIHAGGRDLTPPKRLPEASHPGALAGMDAVFSGKLEFSLEYTDEFVQGHVLGLDPVVLDKLKAGAYSLEGHVDLHGQNMEQAYATLAAFIRHAYQGGKRHIVVVTGRGRNSPGGMPVLRERVQTWLTRDPFKRVVLGFCSARPGDGGVGALYVLLRKRKKGQGKVVWNLTPSEEELLL